MSPRKFRRDPSPGRGWRTVALSSFAAAAASATFLLLPSATAAPAQTVEVCHSTGAGTYQMVRVSTNGLNGHAADGADIVPNVSNWGADGQAIWAAGCVSPAAESTAPDSVTESESAVPESDTTTPEPENTAAEPEADAQESDSTAPEAPETDSQESESTAAEPEATGSAESETSTPQEEGSPSETRRTPGPVTTSPAPGGQQITLCHATGSETNAYVAITVSVNAVAGHSGHERDIIPAFTDEQTGVFYAGLNLDGTGSAILAAGCMSPAPVTTSPAPGGQQITLCHATGSETNAYVAITVSVNAVAGHSGHERDIIPAFTDEQTGVFYAGLNLDATGSAILAAGCVVPVPVTTSPAPVTTSPAPVTTSPAPVTTSPAPVTTSPAPVTTSPAPVTTSPAPVTTSPAPVTTSPAPVTTSPAPVTTSPAPVTTSPAPVTTSPAPVTTSGAAVVPGGGNAGPGGQFPIAVSAGGGPFDPGNNSRSPLLWFLPIVALAITILALRQSVIAQRR